MPTNTGTTTPLHHTKNEPCGRPPPQMWVGVFFFFWNISIFISTTMTQNTSTTTTRPATIKTAAAAAGGTLFCSFFNSSNEYLKTYATIITIIVTVQHFEVKT